MYGGWLGATFGNKREGQSDKGSMLRFLADVFQTPGEPSEYVGSLSVVELSLTLGKPNSGSQIISDHQSHPESVTCKSIISHPRRVRRGSQGLSSFIKQK